MKDRLFEIPSWGTQFDYDRVANDRLEGKIRNFEVTGLHDHGKGQHVDLNVHNLDGTIKKYVGLTPDPNIKGPKDSFGW
ncbi:MAG: hypothetical protein U5R06_23535 [candidate division KSB1 bacterium]|nr:hypothetical protein [candidate division KSB1 bacterium]